MTFITLGRLLIIMSLTIILSSSSFFLANYLTDKINQAEITFAQLTIATELKLPLAYQQQLTLQTIGSEGWQKYSRLLANKSDEQAYLLARFYQDRNDGSTNKSEMEGSDLKQAIFWYQKASRGHHSKARFALANIYIAQNKVTEAERLLAECNNMANCEQYFDSLKLRIEIALAQGNKQTLVTLIQQWQQLSGDLLSKQQQRTQQYLLSQLQYFSVFDAVQANFESNLAERLNKKNSKLALACKNSVQLFATRLADLVHLEVLLSKFAQHPLSGSFCFSPPRYIPLHQLQCESGGITTAISCDEAQWHQFAENINSRYLGIMLPEGGANVHLGIAYLDSHDDHLVFAHELAHLLGFIDEYPLPEKHLACTQKQTKMFANNIAVLASDHLNEKQYQNQDGRLALRKKLLAQLPWAKQIKTSTPIIHLKKEAQGLQSWVIGTPESYKHEVGLFKSDTCNTAVAQAYKPLSTRTFMQSYEAPFPSSYQQVLTQWQNQHAMPSFHYNIALAKYRAGHNIQAKHWLKMAELQESDSLRQRRVRLGEY